MSIDFRSTIALALSATLVFAGAARAQSPTTTRVSEDTSGAQGDAASMAPSISADGRLVAFESAASNLVVGDTNGVRDIFVHDRTSGTTERVSLASGGTEGNADSISPSLSADGRFVAFVSFATNFVAGDTNGVSDVFVHDRTSGTTECVSVSTGGALEDHRSWRPSISADGRFVAFESDAPNLVAGDTNHRNDVFVRDRMSATTERISVSTGGAQGNAGSALPSISADGRFVTFTSGSRNLVAGDSNGVSDVFVRDRMSATTERASVAASGAQGNSDSAWSSISADGRFVAFTSIASNLVAGDTNLRIDIFVRDRLHSTTERVSVASSGAQGDNDSYFSSISADGRFVAFDSFADNLVSPLYGISSVYLRDRAAGTTERVSVDTAGFVGNSGSSLPSISTDGGFVAFQSDATNFVTADTNGVSDVFVRDRGALPVLYCTSSVSSHGCGAIISASGHPHVWFGSPCNITVTHVEGRKSGVLFYGINNAGFAPRPFAFGSTSWLCVQQPGQRTPIQDSGGTINACDGTFALDWNAYQLAHPLALGNPWSVGDKVYVQAWFRDPPAVKSSNLSNALELTYQP